MLNYKWVTVCRKEGWVTNNYVNNYIIYNTFPFKSRTAVYVFMQGRGANSIPFLNFCSCLNVAAARSWEVWKETLRRKVEPSAFSFANVHTFMAGNKLDKKSSQEYQQYVSTGKFLLAKTACNISPFPRTDRSHLISQTVSLQTTTLLTSLMHATQWNGKAGTRMLIGASYRFMMDF